MSQLRYRKHPRVYNKKLAENSTDNTLTLSGAAALGIIAFTFVKGMFWGYLLKKKLG